MRSFIAVKAIVVFDPQHHAVAVIIDDYHPYPFIGTPVINLCAFRNGIFIPAGLPDPVFQVLGTFGTIEEGNIAIVIVVSMKLLQRDSASYFPQELPEKYWI